MATGYEFSLGGGVEEDQVERNTSFTIDTGFDVVRCVVDSTTGLVRC